MHCWPPCGTGARSLAANSPHSSAEYLGHLDDWPRASDDLLETHRLDAADARRMRWHDVFGQLIGNTDRHFGNISFFVAQDNTLRLAPVYDMLPMLLAPHGAHLVARHFDPAPPTAANFDLWPDAAIHAVAYWDRLATSAELSSGFRELCTICRDMVATRASQIPGARA
jgi:hypothetical protein